MIDIPINLLMSLPKRIPNTQKQNPERFLARMKQFESQKTLHLQVERRKQLYQPQPSHPKPLVEVVSKEEVVEKEVVEKGSYKEMYYRRNGKVVKEVKKEKDYKELMKESVARFSEKMKQMGKVQSQVAKKQRLMEWLNQGSQIADTVTRNEAETKEKKEEVVEEIQQQIEVVQHQNQLINEIEHQIQVYHQQQQKIDSKQQHFTQEIVKQSVEIQQIQQIPILPQDQIEQSISPPTSAIQPNPAPTPQLETVPANSIVPSQATQPSINIQIADYEMNDPIEFDIPSQVQQPLEIICFDFAIIQLPPTAQCHQWKEDSQEGYLREVLDMKVQIFVRQLGYDGILVIPEEAEESSQSIA